MNEDHRLIADRKRKLEEIRAQGIDPYPYTYEQTHYAAELHAVHKGLGPEQRTGENVSIAGRIVLFRRMGKLSFMEVRDASGQIQVMLRKDNLQGYGLLKHLDMGDWIGVRGEIITTKTGELTVLADSFEVLCKSLRPLPEKYHGLKDEELRFRRRYLDLAMNPEVQEIFRKRAKIIQVTREVLNRRGFLEVETPVLDTVYGGANARPFITHINAWDMPMYLSISPELYLKRLLVGGLEKVYTICKNFRNEGVDQTHNPEFTMMECYQAYVDYNTMMEITEEIYEEACKAINGTTKVSRDGVEIDFKRPWKRIRFNDAISAAAGLDVDDASTGDLLALAQKHDLQVNQDMARGEILIELFEHFAESALIDPCHIIDHPIESTPLCKTLRSGDETTIERFESFAFATELSNAYSELNDPIKQRDLFEKQAEKGRGGDEEAHPMDEDYVEALEYGMPPAGGLGIGIDRMIILLTEQAGIRDVMLFPTMKPESSGSKPSKPLQLTVGMIAEVEDHPDADKLYVLTVDFKSETRRIVSSLKGHYAKDALAGKTALFVTNLASADFRGVVSEGMILCADDGDETEVIFVDAPAGTIALGRNEEDGISIKEFTEHDLRVENGNLLVDNSPLVVGGTPIIARKLKDAKVR